MSATAARDRAILTAKTDSVTAYSQTQRIADSWFRCQALAWVARYCDDKILLIRIREALKVALETDDLYRAVGSSAWPIRALVERKRDVEASLAVANLLPIAARITNPVQQGDALFLLWQAVYPIQPGADDVLHALVTTCHAMDSWKGPRLLRDLTVILAKNEMSKAQIVLGTMPDGRMKRQTERRVKAGAFMEPRLFFR